jgi:hypothetical protein
LKKQAKRLFRQQKRASLIVRFLARKETLERKNQLEREQNKLMERVKQIQTNKDELTKQAEKIQADEDRYAEEYQRAFETILNPSTNDHQKWVYLRQKKTLGLALKEHMPDIAIFDISLFEIRQAIQRDCAFFKSVFVDFLRIFDGHKTFLGARFKNNLVDSGLSIFTDDPAGEKVNLEFIIANPASKMSFDSYRKWMNYCTKSHQECQKPSSTFMSTRVVELLHVNGRLCIRLRETKCEPAEKGPYAALSYC